MFYDAFPSILIDDLNIVLNLIPNKTYNNVSIGITDLEYEKLNKVQKELLCCIQTKSCDEYVIEFFKVIYDKLKDRDNYDSKDFCLKNKFAIKRSYSRMMSYWNELYRDREFNFHRYVGRKLFKECFGDDRTFER